MKTDLDSLKYRDNLQAFIDIGNSTADILLTDLKDYTFIKKKYDQLSFLSEIKLKKVYIASVNTTGTNKLLESINIEKKDINIISRDMMKDYSIRHDLKIDNLDILGTDLFLDIISKENKSGEIIIDLGTASKIMYISKEKVFYGAMIFPGLSSFPETLGAKAELLSNCIIDKTPPIISLKSELCISSGVINGASFIISSTVEEIIKEYKCDDADIYLTGGNAYLINDTLKKYLDHKIVFDELHVIKGLLRFFDIDIYFI